MGHRKLMRVPLDFKWPLHSVWHGYTSDDPDIDWDKFEPTDPPAGDGYQLWETVSEGSPISPVFAKPEELADWCADNATVFAGSKMSRDKWLEMFIGKRDLEMESLFIIRPGYSGPIANDPKQGKHDD